MECPKCGHAFELGGGREEPAEADACPSCGVILVKAFAMAGGMPKRPRARGVARGEPIVHLAQSERRAIAVGLALGVAAWILPLSRYLFSYALTVVHELGHSAAGWSFGYPTIPSFDFAYGGGVSIHFGRSLPLALVAAAVVVILVWRLRGTRAFGAALAVALLYASAAVTPLHDALVLAAGHGAELLLAGICLYRALSSLHWPAGERAAYAAFGVFTLASAAHFGWQLLASVAFRRSYEQAKGGGHWMDLSRLAEGFLGADLAVAAALFCIAVLATPLAAYLAAVNRPSLAALGGRA